MAASDTASPIPAERPGWLPDGSLAAQLPRLGRRLATAALPFGLLLYLALNGGGYGAITLGEVGIAAWWIVLIGVVTGVLPARRLDRAAWVGLALLIALGGWAMLGIGWSESAERSAADAARTLSLVGVFALALLLQGHRGLSRTVGAVGAAIAVVGVLALLSRLDLGSFPANETARFLPETADRLNYPLNYWNGLAALMVMGVPLLLAVAMGARRVLTRSVAVGAIPVLALVAYYTLSRGGVLELAVALAVFIALCPKRLAAAPIVLIAAAASALAVAAASQRDLVEQGLGGAAADAQASEMLAVALVAVLAAGLLTAAVTLATRSGWLTVPRVPRRNAGIATAVAAALALIAFVAAGGPSFAADRWEEFKSPDPPGDGVERFESASGNDRWQYWEASVEANETDPLIGTGPGTFEYWWARNGTELGFVRDAHSLYLETLGESGWIGLGLLLACLSWPVVQASRRLRRASAERRFLLAGVVAAMAAFFAAGTVEWVWELPVIPAAFLLLAAAVLGSRPERREAQLDENPSWAIARRVAVGAVAVGALVAIAIPLAAAKEVRSSQLASAGGDPTSVSEALADARRAADIQPYAATPLLQQALILESVGQLDEAEAAAAGATVKEPTNWRTWLTLARVQAKAGEGVAALESYRRARELNPRSPIFLQTEGGSS